MLSAQSQGRHFYKGDRIRGTSENHIESIIHGSHKVVLRLPQLLGDQNRSGGQESFPTRITEGRIGL